MLGSRVARLARAWRSVAGVSQYCIEVQRARLCFNVQFHAGNFSSASRTVVQANTVPTPPVDASDGSTPSDWRLLDVRRSYGMVHMPSSLSVLLASPFAPQLKDPSSAKHVITAQQFALLAAAARLPAPASSPPLWVIDDGMGSTDGCRTAWVLHLYGFSQAAVVDGGWPAIVREFGERAVAGWAARPEAEAEMRASAAVAASVRTALAKAGGSDGGAQGVSVAAALKISADSRLLATLDEIAADLTAHFTAGQPRRLQILDVRTPGEFSGDDARGNARTGHIPGAVNIPHSDLFERSPSDGIVRMRRREELEALFKEAGLINDPERPVVSICQAGIRATVGWAALRSAGWTSAKVYDGSMGEWLNSGRDDALVE